MSLILLLLAAFSGPAFSAEPTITRDCDVSYGASAPGQMGVLTVPGPDGITRFVEPVPANALYDVVGISHPLGQGKGPLYHLVPKNHIDRLKALEGDKFVPAQNEFSEAPGLYAALGFKSAYDPRIGHYWSEVPSSELMQQNIDSWNAKANGDPKKMIHIKFLTAGAHNQVDMARYQSDGYIGMADPYGVHTEPYAPTNAAPPKPADHQKLVIDPRSGRVVEANGLFMHDVGHMVNAVHMNKATVDAITEMSRFYTDVYALFQKSQEKGKKLRMNNAEAKEIRDILLQFTKNGESPVDTSQPGIAATRYISVMMMHSQSSYHGYEHMLGWLIRNPAGLDPKTFTEGSRGSTFQREAVFHIMRVGVKAPGSTPFFSSPVGVLTHRQASDKGPLTLERSIDFITNVDRERADTLMKDLQSTFQGDADISRELSTLAKRYENMLKSRFSQEEINQMAQETRDRYKAFGTTPTN